MKKLIVRILIISIFYAFYVLPSYSSTKEINTQKEKALKWHEHNISQNHYDLKKESESLKNRALRWYQNNLTNIPSYNKHQGKETAFKKEKALKWHDKHNN